MESNITMGEKHIAKIADFFYNETFSNTTDVWEGIKNLTGFEEYGMY